ncbi:hypothetical protein Ct61P_09094 [Colletotrichum tofieldiae]|nr:hypothetical protein Ct61P_09094 [Colletotrichum tofieldiae]
MHIAPPIICLPIVSGIASHHTSISKPRYALATEASDMSETKACFNTERNMDMNRTEHRGTPGTQPTTRRMVHYTVPLTGLGNHRRRNGAKRRDQEDDEGKLEPQKSGTSSFLCSSVCQEANFLLESRDRGSRVVWHGAWNMIQTECAVA